MKLFLKSIGFILIMTVQAQAGGPSVEVKVVQGKKMWSYSITNNGPDPLSIFSLHAECPLEIAKSPDGWAAEHNGCGVVSWASKDSDAPFSHDIKPGSTLSGFVLRTSGTASTKGRYMAQPWIHPQGMSGKAIEGEILVPGSSSKACVCGH